MLTGPSVALDPLTHAVRSDLADVRLARFVFAPHYAAAVSYRVVEGATLRAGRGGDAEALVTLARDDVFEVLDLVAGQAWGVAPGHQRVGWVDARILDRAA